MIKSDETAAQIAESTDEEFAALLAAESAKESAGMSDNSNDEHNITPVEDKSLDEDNSTDEPSEPNPDKGETDESNTHDVDATLNEDVPPETPKVEVKADQNLPRFEKDAKNLAEKWERMPAETQMKKVENLAKSRPHTLKALAAELGTTPELLLDQHELDSTDFAGAEELPEIDVDKISKDAEDKAYARFQAEQAKNTDVLESERNRFVTEVSKYAKHNKLDAKTTEAITSIDGDLLKTFESIKFDPVSGEKLSMKARLKLSIKGNDSINEALISAGVLNRSKKVLAGVNAGLPAHVQGKSTKSISTGNADVANSSDDDFNKTMDSFRAPGVAEIKF